MAVMESIIPFRDADRAAMPCEGERE